MTPKIMYWFLLIIFMLLMAIGGYWAVKARNSGAEESPARIKYRKKLQCERVYAECLEKR